MRTAATTGQGSPTSPRPARAAELAAEDALPDFAMELQTAVARIYRRVRAETQTHQLSDTQYSVLAHLTKHGPATLRALSERERVSPPAMNQTVNALQTAGLITRHPDPSDGRKVLITATDRAVASAAQARAVKRAWLNSRLEVLTDPERKALREAARIFTVMADS